MASLLALGAAKAAEPVHAIRTIADIPTAARTLVFEPGAGAGKGTPSGATTAARKPARVIARRARALPEDDPATRRCVESAAAAFDIEPYAMYLILDVEGGTVGKVSENSNGTYDIGPAQVNSSHLRTFAAHGITEEAIRDDRCVNILAGAWLYKDARDRAPNVAKAIALYHSPTPKYQRRYLERVYEAIERRQARAQFAIASANH